MARGPHRQTVLDRDIHLATRGRDHARRSYLGDNLRVGEFGNQRSDAADGPTAGFDPPRPVQHGATLKPDRTRSSAAVALTGQRPQQQHHTCSFSPEPSFVRPPWRCFPLYACRHIRGGQKQRAPPRKQCKNGRRILTKQSAQRQSTHEAPPNNSRHSLPESPARHPKDPYACPSRAPAPSPAKRHQSTDRATEQCRLKKPSATTDRHQWRARTHRPNRSHPKAWPPIQGSPHDPCAQGAYPAVRVAGDANDPMHPDIKHPPFCAARQRGGLPRRKSRKTSPQRRVQGSIPGMK